MSNENKKYDDGKSFLIVSILLFVIIGALSLHSLSNHLNDRNNVPLWAPLLVLFATVVNIFRSIRNKQKNYAIGSVIISIGIILFMIVPAFL